jgi:hypothetical protein
VSLDLLEQLAAYGEHHRACQDPVALSGIVVAETDRRPPADLSLDLSPESRDRSRLWRALAVAAAVVLVVGALGWLAARNGRTGPAHDPKPTTISPTTTSSATSTPAITVGGGVEAPSARVRPGAWTVAATLPGGEAAAGTIADVVEEVRTWDGVIDVAEVSGASAWRDLTGLTSECAEGESAPPCGSGVAVLTVDSSMGPTALRLRSDFGMNVLTPLDAPERFLDGYLDAAVATASPVALQFDPSAFGVEQPLIGPLLDYEPEVSVCGGPCAVAIQVDADGRVETAGIGSDDVELSWSITADGGGSGFSVGDLLVDRSGRAGVLHNLGLDGRRSVYGFAFLPLEAALVHFELADGSSVWQRPLAGMALLVNQPRTGTSPEPVSEGPFLVLDANGREIMRIEGTPDGPRIDDLRFDTPDAADPGSSITTETVASVPGGPVVLRGGEAVTFADDFVVADGAIWLQTEEAIVTVDTTTFAVDRIPIDRRGRMLVTPGAIWVGSDGFDGDGSVSRIDLASRTVTDRIEIPGSVQHTIDLIVADGGLWVTGSPTGYLRVDLATLGVTSHPAEVGQETTWVGDIDGQLWSRGSDFLSRIDPSTGDAQRFDIEFNTVPGGAVVADDAIWLVESGGQVVRFDTSTGLITDRRSLGNVPWWSGVVADDAVWFIDGQAETVTGFDAATAEIVAAITVRPGATELTAHDGAIWVSHGDGHVSRIDIETRQMTDVMQIGGSEVSPIAVDDDIWFVSPEGTITRATGTT